jgi:hypothetical protein
MGCEYAAYVELLFPNATVLGMMQFGADKEGSGNDACHSMGGNCCRKTRFDTKCTVRLVPDNIFAF